MNDWLLLGIMNILGICNAHLRHITIGQDLNQKTVLEGERHAGALAWTVVVLIGLDTLGGSCNALVGSLLNWRNIFSQIVCRGLVGVLGCSWILLA